ncbi:MAG: aminotransferase class V-fold PLP-dependent enzyme [Curvibacter sp.]|nr:MAG: aminotransferase class V-fold PLP-dependent enzyme [Curvibacter sp.]
MTPDLPTELYLDFNATSAVLPEAAAAAQAAMLSAYGNPSSTHALGWRAQALLNQTRQRAREVLGASTGRLLFTSGATEGIQTAVLSALCGLRERRRQGQPAGRVLLYGATEHKAVPEALNHWNQVLGLGFEVRALPVDSRGRHDLAALRDSLPEVGLLCTMAANNETGVVSDLAGIEATLRGVDSPALWLVDGVQALGKLSLNLAASRIDYAPFSGHKLHAPKGIGLLFVREGSPFTPLIAGGGQEGGARSGTENMPGIAALGVVLAALQRGDTFCPPARLQAFRERLRQTLELAFPGVVLNAALEDSLPTTLNFSWPGVPVQGLMSALEAAGLMVSAGSACSAAQAKPSAVLAAMGLPASRSTASVRLSLGLLVDEGFVDQVCQRLLVCGAALQNAGASVTATVEPAVTGLPEAPVVAPQALPEWLARHPQARLVDVRDPHEHLASGLTRIAGRPVQSVPLADLAQVLPRWLGEPTPLLFFCRSGARSQRAAALALAQGHPEVGQLAGGLLALADVAPLARPGAAGMPVSR